MKEENRDPMRFNLRLDSRRKEDVELKERLNRRDKIQFPRMVDYIEKAVSEYEDGQTITIKIRFGTLSDEERRAVMLLLDHNN